MADFDSVKLAEALGAGIAVFAGKAGKFGLRLAETESEIEHAVTAEERLAELTAQAEDNRNRIARELAAEKNADQIIHVTFEAEAVQAQGTAADAPSEDQFWADARQRMGLQEAHKNALYFTATLLHVDKPNSNGDIVPRAEAEAALGSLVGQPIDISPGMDMHERERLWGMNGIRGFVYASRIVADAIQVGAVLWAHDFPDIAEGVVDFRDSLGASFDLVAKSADYRNMGDPDQKTERSLRGITFLGGAILAKNRAADSTTQIGDVRYGGKPIEQIEEEQRMAEQAKTDKEATAATTVETPPAERSEANPVETALAASQAEVKALAAKLETAEAQAAVAEEKLTQVTVERDELKAKCDQAEAEFRAAEEVALRAERIKLRMEALEAMASENKRVLAEKDEEKTAIAEQVADLTDEQFETFKLQTELRLLKTTAAKTEETLTEAQAAAGKGAGAGVFGILNAGGAGLASGKPADLGRRIAEASTRRKAE